MAEAFRRPAERRPRPSQPFGAPRGPDPSHSFAAPERSRPSPSPSSRPSPRPSPRPGPSSPLSASMRSHDFEDDTQELPPVGDGPDRADAGAGRPFGFGPGLRRAAVAVAVTAAALVGFGCALLLPGRGEAATPQPSHPATTPAAAPAGATDPDGPGTLREGDSGKEVTELEQRLLRIPDVYPNGSTAGRYDAQLTAAVARFQLWYGIRGDENGVYGNDTREALESRTTLDAT
nr:peptidoglycan-binding domain-containing protein [Streptomyces mangrovisoli]